MEAPFERLQCLRSELARYPLRFPFRFHIVLPSWARCAKT